jgi:hypothetical protein
MRHGLSVGAIDRNPGAGPYRTMITLALLAAVAADPLAACAAAVHDSGQDSSGRTAAACADLKPVDRRGSPLDTPICGAALAIGRATRDAADRPRMVAEFDRHAVQCRQSSEAKAPLPGY